MAKSVYIHIPFCDHICGYCGFTKFNYERSISDRFLIRLFQQIKELPDNLETIYVGGGTPTALEDDQLLVLLESLKPKLAIGGEFTFEGNPENLSEEKVQLLIDYGVNRMSLGVQTTDDDLLEKIGRHHKFYDVEKGVNLLRRLGLNNVSLDLIYGLPGQTLESFIDSMSHVLALKPDHVSIYALTIEENSLFGRKGIEAVSSDLETEMFLACIDLMKKNGYEHYEISNFALNGNRSKHNQVYWRYEDFYALGPGSSLKLNHQRKTWTSTLGQYMTQDAYSEVIDLSLEDEMFEFIMMGLRMKDGIEFSRFYDRFNLDMKDVFKQAIDDNLKLELIEMDHNRITTTHAGFVMLDDVLLRFMD